MTSDEKRQEDADRYYHETPHRVHRENHTCIDVINVIAYALRRADEERGKCDFCNKDPARFCDACMGKGLIEAMQETKNAMEPDTLEADIVRLAEKKKACHSLMWKWEKDRLVPRSYFPHGIPADWHDTLREAVKKALEEVDHAKD